MLNFFALEPIEILRKTESESVDRFGNPVESETVIASAGVVGFRGTTESKSATGSTSVDEYRIVFPQETDIQPGDVFRIRGLEWIQDGTPVQVTPAFGGFLLPPGKIINVKKVTRNG